MYEAQTAPEAGPRAPVVAARSGTVAAMREHRPAGRTSSAARSRRTARKAAVAAGAVLAAGLLTGCNGGATTVNAVTPGPPLPNGMSLPPGAAHYQLSTPSLSPSP
jgi:hypothetical protein